MKLKDQLHTWTLYFQARITTFPGHHLPIRTQVHFVYGTPNLAVSYPRADTWQSLRRDHLPPSEACSIAHRCFRLRHFYDTCPCLAQESEVMSTTYQTRAQPVVGMGTQPKILFRLFSKEELAACHTDLTYLKRLPEVKKQFNYKPEDWHEQGVMFWFF